MPGIRIPKTWEISEREVTPEEMHLNRRKFLAQAGKAGLGALALSLLPLPLGWAGSLMDQTPPGDSPEHSSPNRLTPDSRDSITPESIVTGYNNFYEFSPNKESVRRFAQNLRTDGWTIKVGGLVQKPRVIDVEKLIRGMPLEERIYRLRCVEAWSCVIPWRGFPLRALIKSLDPLSTTRFVKFTTFLSPNEAAGQKQRFWEPWPYTEGLSLKEAKHDLSFLATGIYGHSLPKQNGAPIRLVVPWKYGFKSIKSIVAIEFTRDMPQTFWQSVSPLEYDFWADVRPDIPYARWHQESEYVLGKEEKVMTRLYNGYAEQVAGLYL